VAADEERIALFLDYENLAIGARESLGGAAFDLAPVADALAERGRVVVRRAYADWNLFDEDRRMLTRQQVELIEIPQRMGASRKNAADIKMAVDAVELSFERGYITTFVLGTGDSDFTPLVHKLRELNRRVIGIGVEASTSALLPAACDEFLFYERLPGVEPRVPGSGGSRRRGRGTKASPAPVPAPGATEEAEAPPSSAAREEHDIAAVVRQTLAGLQSSTSGPVYASTLKRTILRKDPTFNEADHGFRAFGELLRHLADRGVVELSDSGAKGDPEVGFPAGAGESDAAFALLHDTVAKLGRSKKGPVLLSGLKDRLRKEQPDFDEGALGYRGFLQFCRAAQARGVVELDYDAEAGDYALRPVAAVGAGDAPAPVAPSASTPKRRPSP